MSFKKRSSACLLSVGAILCAVFFILPSCQGPAGPAGKDGITKHDTISRIDTILKKDTVIKRDSLYIIDTTIHPDTVYSKDSLIIFDTTVTYDTVVKYDTTLMNPNCAVCHNSTQIIIAKAQQWEMTRHAEGLSVEEQTGNRVACQPCHNGNLAEKKFIADSTTSSQFMTLTSSDSADANNVSNINCRVCHKIHTKNDTSDLALRGQVQVTSRAWGVAYKWPNVGKSNLCVNCHQYREMLPMDTAIHSDSVSIGSARFGGHVASQAGLYFAKGAYEDPDYASLKPTAPNGHLLVKDACIGCHVAAGNAQSHNFIAQAPSCNVVGCHVGIPKAIAARAAKTVLDPTDIDTVSALGRAPANDIVYYFNADSSQIEVRKLLNEARDSLVAKGLIKINHDDTYYGFSGLSTTPATMVTRQWAGLYQNYKFLVTDLSNGVHNPKYTKYLLVSGLKGIGVTRDLSAVLQ